MKSIFVKPDKGFVTDEMLNDAIKQSLEGRIESLKKVLIIPPDFTRFHSLAGKITAIYYNLLKNSCEIDILPALGTHDPMTKEQVLEMFGPDVPFDRFIHHNWKKDVIKIGEVPAEFVAEVSEGLVTNAIAVR